MKLRHFLQAQSQKSLKVLQELSNINPNSSSALKMAAFKSFDKRRVGTNLERREGNQ